MTRIALAATLVIGVAWAAGGAAANGGPALGSGLGTEVLSADGSLRYVALTDGRVTLIAAAWRRDDRVDRAGWIRGSYGIPLVANDGSTEGLTRDGRTLVLAPFVGPETTTSRFAFVDTKKLRPSKVVALRGPFSFDALSPDGQTLYLIQYLKGKPARYVVRAYDVREGRLLQTAIADPREQRETMSGSPVTRVASRDRVWAYTLYHRPGSRPFVHALDTEHRRAVCVDLPWRNVRQAMWSVRMSLVAGGRRIVLRQPGVRRLASIDTRTFAVRGFRRPG